MYTIIENDRIPRKDENLYGGEDKIKILIIRNKKF